MTHTVRVQLVDDEPAQVIASPVTKWSMLEFRFGTGETFYAPSHIEAMSYFAPSASYMGTAPRIAMIAEGGLSEYSKNCGYLNGRSTFTKPTYTLLDTDGEASKAIQDKAVNGRSTFNITVKEYEWEAYTTLEHIANPNGDIIVTLQSLKGTWLFKNHSWSQGLLTIQCADINRNLDAEVFDTYQWRVIETVTETAERIKIDLPVGDIPNQDVFFQRGNHYHEYPGENGFYFIVDDTQEICFCTAMENVGGVTTLTVKRGQRQTTPAEIEVPEGTEESNRKTITEWIFFAETYTTIAYALVTGKVFGGNAIPAHWTAGMDESVINLYSYAQHSSTVQMKFEGLKKQKLKKFLEDEILSKAPAVHTINNRGQLVWTPVVTPTENAAGQILLNESNCINTGALKLEHDKSGIYTSVAIEYDYDALTDKYLTKVVYDSPDSVAHHGGWSRVRTVQSKGLHTGIHTFAQIRKIGAAIGDDSLYEKQRLTVESLINNIELGQIVTAQFDHVHDDASNEEIQLDRAMIVIAAKETRAQGTIYTLLGTQQVASNALQQGDISSLTPAQVRAGGSNLTAQAVTVNLTNHTMTGTLNLECGQKYYYVDPDEAGHGIDILGSATINIIGTGAAPQIFCYGPLIIRPDVNLTAKSGNSGGAGGDGVNPPRNGQTGYLGGQRPGGALSVTQQYFSYLSANETVYSRRGFDVRAPQLNANYPRGHSRIPELALDRNNGSLFGFPANLGGSGGSGGPASRYIDPDRRPRSAGGSTNRNRVDEYIPGSDGGDGGGSLVLASWGGAIFGTIIVDGGRAQPPTFSHNVVGGEGAPGDAGGVLWLVIGNYPLPVFTSSNISARPGQPWLIGLPSGTQDAPNSFLNSPKRSKFTPAAVVNKWREHARAFYIPAAEGLQTRFGSIIDEFFHNVSRGRARLYIGNAPPSNSNIGDARITQEQLDSNEADPEFYIRDVNGWRLFERGVDRFEYIYDALISGKRNYGSLEVIVSPNRPQGEPDGTIWINLETGAEWLLYENADDVLLRVNFVPVGENLLIARGGSWIFTRNGNLEPINITAPSASTGGGGGVDPIFNLRYEAPFLKWDQGAYTIYDVKKGSVNSQQYITTITAAPYQYDISPHGDGDYFVTGVLNGQSENSAPISVVIAGQSSGITLTDQGRTVAGTAIDPTGTPISEGSDRIKLTLGVETGDPVEIFGDVGAGGVFSITVPSLHDALLNKLAQLNASNGSDAVLIRFVYER